MQSAETVLGVLRERGRRGLPCEELYRQLFNPQLYLLAYGRIYANKGAMTPGVTQETVDGMSLGKIGRIIDAMRHERYRFRPVDCISRKRTERPVRWGCRPGRTSSLARWCACCWRRITNRRFPTAPTGFAPVGAVTPRCGRWPTPGPGRPGSSRATSPTASAVSIIRYVLSIIGEKIRDNRFLRLLRNIVTAGYLEDWTWGATLSGVPQGGVASPVLSNIYLHKLDSFVENVLIPEHTRGQRRARNPHYRQVERAIKRARRRDDRAGVRTLYRRLHSLPSQDPNDPGYRRLRYCRYADRRIMPTAA